MKNIKDPSSEDSRIRLMRLMLYREAGGIGYDLAIKELAEYVPDFYLGLQRDIKSIKEDVLRNER